MITSLVFLTLGVVFSLSYLQISQEELIVGVWKHYKDDVFFIFLNDGSMCFKIPCAQRVYEISGKYKMIDRNLLKIELDYQYGAISGEPIFSTPQVLHVTIHENTIIFHGLKTNQSEEQKFIRIK